MTTGGIGHFHTARAMNLSTHTSYIARSAGLYPDCPLYEGSLRLIRRPPGRGCLGRYAGLAVRSTGDPPAIEASRVRRRLDLPASCSQQDDTHGHRATPDDTWNSISCVARATLGSGGGRERPWEFEYPLSHRCDQRFANG